MKRPFVHTQTVVRTSSDAAYASGDALGTLMTIPFNDGAGLVMSTILVDLDGQSRPMKVFIFDDTPAGSTVTDNGALTIADSDMKNIAGIVDIAASDYVALADNSVASKDNLFIPIHTARRNVYTALQLAGTATYSTDASNIIFKIYIDKD